MPAKRYIATPETARKKIFGEWIFAAKEFSENKLTYLQFVAKTVALADRLQKKGQYDFVSSELYKLMAIRSVLKAARKYPQAEKILLDLRHVEGIPTLFRIRSSNISFRNYFLSFAQHMIHEAARYDQRLKGVTLTHIQVATRNRRKLLRPAP